MLSLIVNLNKYYCFTSGLWPGVRCDDDPLLHSHGLAPSLPVPGVHLEVHWLGRVKAGEEEPGLGARHVPHQAAAVRQPDLQNRRITVQKYNRHTDPMSLNEPPTCWELSLIKYYPEVKLLFRAENFQTMSVQFDGNGMGQERNIFPAYLVLLIMFNKTLRLI